MLLYGLLLVIISFGENNKYLEVLGFFLIKRS